MRKPKKEDAPSFVMFQTTTEKLKKDAFNQERKVLTRCTAVVVLFSLVRCLLRHLSYVQLMFNHVASVVLQAGLPLSQLAVRNVPLITIYCWCTCRRWCGPARL
jgi:hypothetical protein